jgi:hypothetical protein
VSAHSGNLPDRFHPWLCGVDPSLTLHPVDVHYGRTAQIVAARQRVLDAAHHRHPERFVRGRPTQKAPPPAAWINPPPMDSIAPADRTATEEVAAH